MNIPPMYLLASFLYMVGIGIWSPRHGFVPDSFHWSGAILLGAGCYLPLKAVFLMRKLGTPHTFNRSTRVIQEDVFSFSRNPIYLGMILILLGLSVLINNAWTLLAPLFFFLVIRFKFIPFEEKKMEEELGEAYREYKKKVRRWL